MTLLKLGRRLPLLSALALATILASIKRSCWCPSVRLSHARSSKTLRQVEPTGQRGRVAARSGRNVLRTETYVVKTNRHRATCTTKRGLWSSVRYNHRKGPKWPSARGLSILPPNGSTECSPYPQDSTVPNYLLLENPRLLCIAVRWTSGTVVFRVNVAPSQVSPHSTPC